MLLLYSATLEVEKDTVVWIDLSWILSQELWVLFLYLASLKSSHFLILSLASEIFPTCKQLFHFMNSDNALEGEAAVSNGLFTVDPDGPGDIKAFTVNCTFPETVIETNGK